MSRRPDDDEDNPRDRIQQGQPPRRPAPRPDDDDEERPRRRSTEGEGEDEYDGYSGVVPYRNAFALVGYYLGFLGIISILGGFALLMGTMPSRESANLIVVAVIYGGGGISALLAIIFGGVGLARASKGKGTAHAIVAIILGVLEIVALLLILLGVVAVLSR